MTVIETTSTKFDDPRIGKLPQWAQALFQDAKKAERSAVYWNERHEEARNEIDKLRADYARENGAAEFDTWVHEEPSDSYSEAEVRFGLGVGRTVEFGDSSDVCSMYTVTYKDGGLNITGQGAGFALTLPRFGNDTLRVVTD